MSNSREVPYQQKLEVDDMYVYSYIPIVIY